MALPLPKVVPDVGPGGPLVTAMRGGNALADEMLQAQIHGAQAQYAPWTQYADAASKIAYSNMLPYQIQATMMSNPYVWQALANNPQAQNALIRNFSQSIPSPNQLLRNMPPSPSPRSDGLFSTVINKIFDAGQGQSQAPSQQQTMPPQPQGYQGTGADSGYSYDAQGRNIVASPQEIDAVINRGIGAAPSYNETQPDIPSASTIGAQGLPGAQQNPFYQVKSGTASAEALGKANVEMLQDLYKETGNAAIEAQDTINNLNLFKSNYKKLGRFERGYPFGYGPAITDAAQAADIASKNLRNALARQVQQGHITDKDFAAFDVKPTRLLNPDAQEEVSNFVEGAAKRAQERINFTGKLADLGYTAPQINQLWTSYINERPFFDAKNKKIIQKNMNSWPQFLSKEKISQILGGKFSPSQSSSQNLTTNALMNQPEARQEGIVNVQLSPKQAIQQSADVFKNQMIKMQGPDGNVYNVPQGKAQKFIENGFKRIY